MKRFRTSSKVIYLCHPYGGDPAGNRGKSVEICRELALDLGAAPPTSAFSQKGALRQVERLFEITPDVSLTILSYGNAEHSLEELTPAIRPHRRKVEAHEIPYRHMANRALAGAVVVWGWDPGSADRRQEGGSGE